MTSPIVWKGVIALAAIGAITRLGEVAINHGHDGVILATILTLIGGLAGYHLGKNGV